MLKALVPLVFGALASLSCVVGAPPGFSDGDSWSVPLVGPLEDDLILVPVSINDKGPYLFMFDPDSPESSIDNLIQSEHKLFVSGRSRRYTEGDYRLDVPIADVPRIQLGDLTVRNQSLRVHDAGTFWSNDRRIRGIIGRDIIADSLVYTIDRDRGMLYIGTQGHLAPPQDAVKLEYSQGYNAILRHYMAKVSLNRQKKVTMHLDLGARTSELSTRVLQELKIPSVPVQATLVDEYGAKREVKSGAVLGIVEAGKVEANGILVLPFGDKRIDEEEFQGRLGQNFFAKFNVTVNWHKKTFYLKRRSGDLYGTAAERMERWGDALAKCQNPGCVQATLVSDQPQTTAPAATENAPAEGNPSVEPTEPTGGSVDEAVQQARQGGAQPASEPAGGPAPGATPSYMLQIDREDAGQPFAYDVLLEAVDADGKSLGLPRISVTLDQGVPGMTSQPLQADYGAAKAFVVLDINVVGVRGCPDNKKSCITTL